MTSASDELAYLKSLVSQLSDKIKELEVKPASKKTPAQQLRTILVGPPGAGACIYFFIAERALTRIFC
jgi:adenylate kinase